MQKIIKKPEVKKGDWITVGSGVSKKYAVVCQIDKDNQFDDIKVEIVYLDCKRAITENVIWSKDYWKFENPNPCGGYADNYPRLNNFVAILRRGY